MSEPALQLAKAAREQLSAALNALQSNAQVPDELLAVADPIAEAMSVLHRVERSGGADLSGRDVALKAVRAALDALQKVTTAYAATDVIMEHVAMSLAKVNALARYQPPAAPAPAPAAPAAAIGKFGTQMLSPQPQLQPLMQQPSFTAPLQPQPQAYAQQAQQAQLAAQQAQQAQLAAQQAQLAAQQAQAQQAAQQAQLAAQQAHQAQLAAQQAQAQQQAYAQAQQQAYAQQQRQPQQGSAQGAPPAANPYAAPSQQSAARPQQPAPAASAAKGAPSTGEIDVELGTHSGSNFYKGLGGNDVIEHGGIFVATYKVPAIGTTVALRVHLPGALEFQANAVVQWTREAGGAGESAEPGFGARFVQITPEGRQLVYRYTRNREPIFYDDL